MLWIGPFALLAFGAGVVIVMVRRRAARPQREGGDRAKHEEIAKLLE